MPDGQRFQRVALPQLADEGRFAMLTMRLDGRPIAFHSWFIVGSSIYLHRNAFDAEPVALRPGPRRAAPQPRRGLRARARRASSTSAAPSSSSATSPTASNRSTRASVSRAGRVGRAYVARAQLAIAVRKRLKQNERLHRLYLSGALRARRRSEAA